jgi:hypothetical protein
MAGPRAVVVWDVSTAAPTRLAPGPAAAGATPLPPPAPTIALAWSPDGGRLAAVDGAGGVTVWEATTWRSASWAPPAAGGAVGAAWSPAGDALVLALARGSGGGTGGALASLSFVGPPPSLAAHALPHALPPPAAAAPPAGLAWDPAAGRLAVAMVGDEGGATTTTRVALLAADAGPVLAPRGVGVATLPPGRDEGDDRDAGGRVALAFAPSGGGRAAGGVLAVRAGPRRVSFVVVGA